MAKKRKNSERKIPKITINPSKNVPVVPIKLLRLLKEASKYLKLARGRSNKVAVATYKKNALEKIKIVRKIFKALNLTNSKRGNLYAFERKLFIQIHGRQHRSLIDLYAGKSREEIIALENACLNLLTKKERYSYTVAEREKIIIKTLESLGLS